MEYNKTAFPSMGTLFVLAVAGMTCIVSADVKSVAVEKKPDLEFDAVKVSNKHKLRMAVGPMYGDRKDGLGGEGNLYGWLGTFRYDFPVLKNILKREDKRSNLFGRLQAEVLDPDYYYVSDQVACFLRLELLTTF